MANILVAGAGGFIGGHLVKKLVQDGHSVVAVDIKDFTDWNQIVPDSMRYRMDLNDESNVKFLYQAHNFDEIYNLAALAGGVGYLDANNANCLLASPINANLIKLALNYKDLQNFFLASSGCVYNTDVVEPLVEDRDVYPINPAGGYGWEKLVAEQTCLFAAKELGLPITIARFINVYGPNEDWYSEKAKGIASMCYKVIHAKHTGQDHIKIWGNGKQVRGWLYIDDCIQGIQLLNSKKVRTPVNLGCSEVVNVSEIVDVLFKIANIQLEKRFELDKPGGSVRRISDNTKCLSTLGWEPNTKILEGLTKLYNWMEGEYLTRKAHE